MKPLEQVIALLDQSHSVFHVVANMERELTEAGFEMLTESQSFQIKPSGKYYVKRNDSSIIAFKIPSQPAKGYRIAATHNDSPTFVLKPNPVLNKGSVAQLNTEPYGGGLYYSWLDRPLSFAGRVFVKVDDEVQCQLVDLEEDALVIPSLAIHMKRDANDSLALNAARDMIPLWIDRRYEDDFCSYLKQAFDLKGDVLSFDLALYVRENARLVGGGANLLLSPRLDDLSSAYSSLLAFLESNPAEDGNIAVFASFDNEEVGSMTQQGAFSDFMKCTLERVGVVLGWNEDDRRIAQANTTLLSVDNAHANHPNHPECSDPTTDVKLNGGIVLKYNAAQHYTTTGKSAAYVKKLALELNQPIQEFTNRSDMRGGSTLGNLSNVQVSILCADIGIAQLAMHSSVELCGATDVGRMVELLRLHYENKE